MADIKDFKHAIVRQKILDAVRKDLVGPSSENEELNEIPTSSYITGLLYPADTAVTEDENYYDVEFTEKKFDADGESMEAGIFEEDEPEDRIKGGFQKPSSIAPAAMAAYSKTCIPSSVRSSICNSSCRNNRRESGCKASASQPDTR